MRPLGDAKSRTTHREPPPGRSAGIRGRGRSCRTSRRVPELVAPAVAVGDEAGGAGFPQPAPDPAGVGIEGAKAAATPAPPKLSHQLLLGEDAVGLVRQKRHQSELASRQAHLAAATLDPPAAGVDQSGPTLAGPR